MFFEEMYYTKEGDGKVVLFLHGWATDNTIWARQQQALGDKYCIINLDFYGFGKSANPPQCSSVSYYAQKVADLLDHLKVDKLSVVAHSFGGRVAIVLANLIPQKIDKLVLVNSAGLRRFSLIRQVKILAYKIAKGLVKLRLAKPKLLKKFGSSDFNALKSALRGTFIAITQQDLSNYLPQIRCSTLLIWGQNDTQTPEWIARKMLRKISNSSLIYIGKGHFGAYKSPTKFNAILKAFLD